MIDMNAIFNMWLIAGAYLITGCIYAVIADLIVSRIKSSPYKQRPTTDYKAFVLDVLLWPIGAMVLLLLAIFTTLGYLIAGVIGVIERVTGGWE